MKVYVIYGPPCSGKTTYVNERIKSNDIVFDYDKVMKALSLQEEHIHNKNLLSYVLDIRDMIIHKLKFETKIDNAYIITTQVTDNLKKQLIGLNANYIEMNTSKKECLRRLEEDTGNRDVKLWKKLIDNYYRTEKDYSKFYESVEWRSKRKTILSRDNFMCKECSRYGTAVDAETVHHIYPLKQREDLKFNSNNLISLCDRCHEKMHNRYTNQLSKKGEELLSRTITKYPELEEMK